MTADFTTAAMKADVMVIVVVLLAMVCLYLYFLRMKHKKLLRARRKIEREWGQVLGPGIRKWRD